jgi:NADPH2:quinone reductase
VQLAKADGPRVIADASESDEEVVRTLAADVVVRRGDVAVQIRAAVPDGGGAVADGAIQH